MNKIAIVGTGNVAFHLKKALEIPSRTIDIINSRTLHGIENSYDLIIIAVSDDAIENVSKNVASVIPDFRGIVVHTSGSMKMSILKLLFKRHGVFYPLQSFSKSIPIPDYRQIPVFLEGDSDSTVIALMQFASRSFDRCVELSSQLRKQLHLASVYTCNFVNALYGIGHDILKKHNLNYDFLRPLIEYTTLKAMWLSPDVAQTGPARRGDKNLIDSHLEQLADEPDLKNIYSVLSDYIYKKYHHE